MLTKRAGAVVAWLAGAAMVVGSGLPVHAAVNSASPVPDPNFKAVWCSGPRQCLAVGINTAGEEDQPISAVWNGRSWRFVTTPDVGQGLAALGCAAWNECMALGFHPSDIGEWNGRSWKMLPAPSANLFSVTCPDRHRCLAVGSTLYATRRPAALVWNGRKWSRVPVPRPARATSSAFTGVACAGPADCLAVGSYNVIGRDGFPLAMRWNGRSWRRVAAPPAFACTSQIRCAVSCERAGTCVAVGASASVIWNGHSWRRETVPGGEDLLASVSCTSTRPFCVAVGFTSAFAWNGRKWSTMPSTGIENNGVNGNEAVWCTGRAACMDMGDGSVSASFWNGRRWAPIRLLKLEVLYGVSCPQPGNCIAVGVTNNPALASGGLAERWNGTAWRVIAAPGSRSLQISCPSTRFCMADSAGSVRRWNGSRWIATNLSGFLDALSCSGVSNCVAISAGNAWIWDGTTWTPNSPAITGQIVELQAVSCAASTMCMALGFDLSSSCEEDCNVNLLAEQWDGSAWSVSDKTLFGVDTTPSSSVSCPSTTFCVQVTGSAAASWDGHTWTQQTASLPNFVLPSLSCAGPSSCVVVGGYAVSNVSSAYAADVWNGTSWRATKPAGSGEVLNAVSCSASDSCVAVGQTPDALAMAQSWNGSAWKLLPVISP